MRVAQILGKMEGGGVEQTVLNYYHAIDRSKVQFDFFVFEGSSMIPFEEIEALGGTITQLPRFKKPLRYVKKLKALLKNGGYSIVHCHLSTLSFLPLFAAKLARVPVRIIHNHSTSGGKRERVRNLAKTLLKPIAPIFATHRIACSEYAARWMYGKRSISMLEKDIPSKNVAVMRNSIDIEKFSFNENKRQEIRSEFSIADSTAVFGHIGRFCPQKNQSFLLDIFAEIVKQLPDSVLLMAGKGEDMEVIKAKAEALQLSDKVIFAGQRSDADKLYSAFDCFIMPSNYEGLGIVAIEAQCAGLYCLLSNQVPIEAKVSKSVQFLSLNAPPVEWANLAVANCRTRNPYATEEVSDNGYDIATAANVLVEYYLSL